MLMTASKSARRVPNRTSGPSRQSRRSQPHSTVVPPSPRLFSPTFQCRGTSPRLSFATTAIAAPEALRQAVRTFVRQFSTVLQDSPSSGGNTASAARKKSTILDFRQKHAAQQPIVMLTAYDFTSAVLVDKAEVVDAILVGDSLGMVMLGLQNTTSVTMDEMVHHCRAVTAGAPHTFVVGDMPFGSYETSPQVAVANAIRLMKEGKCDAVKLEGGKRMTASIEAIVSAGIPVMGHIGLTPQTQSALGGFRVQGRTAETAMKLIEDAKALEKAGCFAVVVESVPEPVALQITRSINVPTIGIGAGNQTGGQVLVWHDLLGLHGSPKSSATPVATDAHVPKFVKRYRELGAEIRSAVKEFSQEVASRSFPMKEHTYNMTAPELANFAAALNVPVDSLVTRPPKPPAPSTNPTPSASSSAASPSPTAPTASVASLSIPRPSTPKPDSTPPRQKIAIVGGGAMGSLFGAKLARIPAPPEVWLISSWKDHVAAINSRGLELELPDGSVAHIPRTSISATSDPIDCVTNFHSADARAADLALVTVKSHHTRDAAKTTEKLLDANGFALTLQNGLGNREILAEALGGGRVLQGVTSQGATIVRPGRVKWTGNGSTILALPTADERQDLKPAQTVRAFHALQEIAKMLRQSGAEVECVEGIEKVVWGKLLINSAVNPLTAILGVPNGKLLELSEAHTLVRLILQEAASVAKARGITLPWSDPEAAVIEVLKKTATNKSSMLQDVIRGEETEIDAINGAIVREGAKFGIQVPINQLLVSLIKSPRKPLPDPEAIQKMRV